MINIVYGLSYDSYSHIPIDYPIIWLIILLVIDQKIDYNYTDNIHDKIAYPLITILSYVKSISFHIWFC